MKPQTWIWVVGFGVLFGCGAGEGPQEFMDDSDFGAIESSLNKGTPGAASGQYNYCFPTANPAQLCTLGEGVCHSNAECAAGLVCGARKLGQYLAGGQGAACTVAHCTNGVYEPGLGETQRDCGGQCGSICPDLCAGRPANGLEGHCSADCPCPSGQGDCNNNAECQAGLTCTFDVGGTYGYAATVDVCVSSLCNNGVKDTGETGIDCGGGCAPCGGTAVGAQSYGTPTTLENPDDIAFAPNGNDFVVAGRFNGTVNFGCGNMTAAGSTKADVYAAKYDSTGKCLWSIRGGSTQSNDGDYGVSVAIDPSGAVYVAGNFYATSTFLGQSVTVAGGTDIFVLKLTAAGAISWLKRFGGAGIDRVGGIAAYYGGVVLGGDFEQSAQFGTTTLTSAGLNDAVLLSLTNAGAVKWAKGYGSTGLDRIRGVDINPADLSIYAAGDFWDTVDFGAGNLTSAGRADVLAMRVTSAGVTTWSKRFGGASDDVAVDVSSSSNGPIFGGYFQSSVDFGTGTANVATKIDGFALALTAAGAYRWHRVLTGPEDEQVRALSADVGGNTTVTGRFSTSINWGAGSVVASTATDMFAVTYGPTGTLKWGKTVGNAGVDGVAIGKSVVRAVGRFTGTANFDGTQLTAGGSYDAFTVAFPL